MSRFLNLLQISALVFCLALTSGSARADLSETNIYEHVSAKVKMVLPDGTVELVDLKGLAEVQVHFEGPDAGDAQDDSGNGLDEVVTEIVALDLRGVNHFLGVLRVSLALGQPTSGQLEEQVNMEPGLLEMVPYSSWGVGDCFFNIPIELEVMGMNMYTGLPHRIDGRLSDNPPAPGDVLVGVQDSALYDEAMNPNGLFFRVMEIYLNPAATEDHFASVIALLDIVGPDGTAEVVDLTGTAVVATFFTGNTIGSAQDEQNNGIDEVETELAALELTGNSGYLGEVTLSQDIERPSFGVIEELANFTPDWLDLPPFADSGQASSFFDIFFDLNFATVTMTNPGSFRVAATIDESPTGTTSVFSGGGDIMLVDEHGVVTGWRARVRTLQFGPITDLSGVDQLPRLAGQYLTAAPNPFNPRICIRFRSGVEGAAVLRVFDIQGRLVATVHEGSVGIGEHTMFWEGRDSFGRSVASGTYFLRLETAAGITGQKVLLVR